MSILDNLGDLIKRTLFKKDIEQLTDSFEHLLNVLAVYPRTAATEQQEERLFESLPSKYGEWDSQLADLMIRRMTNQDIRKISLDNQTRMMMVKESRHLYVWDVITQYMIELWTDYGFGQQPDIVPRDEDLRRVWREFWESAANQYIFNERELNELSNKLQIDGEYWFAQFISKLDGNSTIRIIETDDIKKIYYKTGDAAIPVYYKREWWTGEVSSEHHVLYYRDFRATDEQAAAVRARIISEDSGAEFAEDNRPSTDVLVFHVKYREINGRGWPFLTAGFAWSRGYKGFLEDRATLNKAAAAVVEKVKVHGGQRMVDVVKQRLQSSLVRGSGGIERNPPPASGSIWVENEAMDREWLSHPTNAADAEKDGVAILAQTALAGKMYPHYLGRGEYYRLATATAMEGPTFRSFQRYQSFWASVWRTLVKMVADAKTKYGHEVFDSYEVDVNQDRIIDTSTKEIDDMMLAVSDGLMKGSIDQDTAIRTQSSLIKMALQTLGAPSVADIVEAEMTETKDGYASAIHSAFYGLWCGALDREGFITMMRDIIDISMRRGWRAGMQEAGLQWEDRTQDEENTLSAMVLAEWQHVPGVADWILERDKNAGGLLRDLAYRESLWANGYQQAYHKALQMARNDPKMKWILGATEQHCHDCLKYAGKVKRASYWRQIGAYPQAPTLECKGIACDCRFEITDDPLSRGYLTPPSGA